MTAFDRSSTPDLHPIHMEFEWDDHKAVGNLAKHEIDFKDAIGIFEGSVLEFRSDRAGEQR